MIKITTAIQAFYALTTGAITWDDLKKQSQSLYDELVRWTTESAYVQAWIIEIEALHFNNRADDYADQSNDDDLSIWDYLNELDQEITESQQDEYDTLVSREEQKTRRQRRISKRLYKRRLLAQAKNRLELNLLDDRLFDDSDIGFARHGYQSKYDAETHHYELIPLSEADHQGLPLWQIESEMAIDHANRWDTWNNFYDRRAGAKEIESQLRDMLTVDTPTQTEVAVDQKAIDAEAAEKRSAEIRQKQRRIEELNSLMMPEDGRNVRQQYDSFNRSLRQQIKHLKTDIEELRSFAA